MHGFGVVHRLVPVTFSDIGRDPEVEVNQCLLRSAGSATALVFRFQDDDNADC